MQNPDIPIDTRTILHLGSGNKYDPRAVNVDLTSRTKPDVVHNLDERPWPFPDNRFDEVLAYDVVEHLQDVLASMEEIHRVCRPGAIVRITVPHFSCANAFTDITHKHFFTQASFDPLLVDHPLAFYTERRFRKQAADIIFAPTWMNKIIWRLARRNPGEYERRWAWMFPAWFLSFELIVDKG